MIYICVLELWTRITNASSLMLPETHILLVFSVADRIIGEIIRCELSCSWTEKQWNVYSQYKSGIDKKRKRKSSLFSSNFSCFPETTVAAVI